MQGRRVVAIASWTAATVGATALVWTATSVVAGEVTDRPAHVVDQGEVAQALRTGEPLPGPEPAPQPTAPAPTARAPQPTRPTTPTTTSTTVAPPTTQAPAPTTTTTTRAPAQPPPTQPPATTPTTLPPGAFAYAGGVIAVTCSGGYLIGLVSATPADGYRVEVLARGPATVDVHFVRTGTTEQIRLVCFNGTPTRIPDQHPWPFPGF